MITILAYIAATFLLAVMLALYSCLAMSSRQSQQEEKDAEKRAEIARRRVMMLPLVIVAIRVFCTE